MAGNGDVQWHRAKGYQTKAVTPAHIAVALMSRVMVPSLVNIPKISARPTLLYHGYNNSPTQQTPRSNPDAVFRCSL